MDKPEGIVTTWIESEQLHLWACMRNGCHAQGKATLLRYAYRDYNTHLAKCPEEE